MCTAKNAMRLVLTAGFVFVGVLAGLGQNEPRAGGQNYRVSLQFVMGSNEGSKGGLPAGLAAIARELKSDFGFSNYRVAGTLLGRVGSNGNYEYKSISNIFGMEAASSMPTFLEWTLQGLHGVTTAKGPALEGATFRFGARVPISTPREEGGKAMNVNYENVGVTAQRFGLSENTPTLVGTLSLPNTPGTVFLVVTARAID